MLALHWSHLFWEREREREREKERRRERKEKRKYSLHMDYELVKVLTQKGAPIQWGH